MAVSTICSNCYSSKKNNRQKSPNGVFGGYFSGKKLKDTVNELRNIYFLLFGESYTSITRIRDPVDGVLS